MCAIAFDTLKFTKRLKEAGFTEEQAEALAAAEAEFIEDNLATKRDIAELKRDMKELEVTLRRDMKELEVTLRRDMKELETGLRQTIKELEATTQRDIAELKRDMKELEYRMTIKLGAMLVVAIGTVATLIKLL